MKIFKLKGKKDVTFSRVFSTPSNFSSGIWSTVELESDWITGDDGAWTVEWLQRAVDKATTGEHLKRGAHFTNEADFEFFKNKIGALTFVDKPLVQGFMVEEQKYIEKLCMNKVKVT